MFVASNAALFNLLGIASLSEKDKDKDREKDKYIYSFCFLRKEKDRDKDKDIYLFILLFHKKHCDRPWPQMSPQTFQLGIYKLLSCLHSSFLIILLLYHP